MNGKLLNGNGKSRQSNADSNVVEGFGDEWSRFDQSNLPFQEARQLFEKYFRIFPWDALPADAVGVDLGCGSGRWARFVSPRVGKVYCIDASDAAITVAKKNLSTKSNCEFYCSTAEDMPLPDRSLDFGYSLGVLHHVPDTLSALRSCTRKLKSNAPFLLYLYYAFDNRPTWYRFIWKLSEAGRFILSRSPFRMKSMICDLIAVSVYWPLARMARIAEKAGVSVDNMPLAAYREQSFYVMRTDALDRFGTRLEKRFTREQIRQMMEEAELKDVRFHDDPPYWVAVGIKK